MAPMYLHGKVTQVLMDAFPKDAYFVLLSFLEHSRVSKPLPSPKPLDCHDEPEPHEWSDYHAQSGSEGWHV